MAQNVRLVSLRDGHAMPQIGFGTWQIGNDDCVNIVGEAIRCGYRAIDTAQGYGNEDGVGRAIAESGLKRSSLFVTSKLANGNHTPDMVRASVAESLDRLRTDYIDLFLIHWPVPRQDLYVEAWATLIELQKEGVLKSIGVSNFTRDQLERLVRETGIAPVVNQIELHPRYQQRDLRAYHQRRGIRIQSWSPMGPGTENAAIWGHAMREGLESLFSEPTLLTIAAAHNKSVAQVIVRWHIDEGLLLCPKSTNPAHMAENLDVDDFVLDAEERYRIEAMDLGLKLGPEPMAMNDV